VNIKHNKKLRQPFNSESLERLALLYVGRYATTRAKLGAYLARKVNEHGWAEQGMPDIEGLAERFANLGYVDDRAFAMLRAVSLQRRGYGERRLDQALYAAGIRAEDAVLAKQQVQDNAWDTAIRFAQRKKIGPFAVCELDRLSRQKAFAVMLRAGHPMVVVQKLIQCRPGDIPSQGES
jgi:regulatory protein